MILHTLLGLSSGQSSRRNPYTSNVRGRYKFAAAKNKVHQVSGSKKKSDDNDNEQRKTIEWIGLTNLSSFLMINITNEALVSSSSSTASTSTNALSNSSELRDIILIAPRKLIFTPRFGLGTNGNDLSYYINSKLGSDVEISIVKFNSYCALNRHLSLLRRKVFMTLHKMGEEF